MTRSRLIYFTVLGLACSMAFGADKSGKESRTMSSPSIKHGLRYDYTKFVKEADSLDAALTRTLVLGCPQEGDAAIIRDAVDKAFEKQKEDGCFGENAFETSTGMYDAVLRGCALDDERLIRAVEAVVKLTGERDAGEELIEEATGRKDLLPIRAVSVLCQMGMTDAPEIGETLRECSKVAKRLAAEGCPWSPGLVLEMLWDGREVADVDQGIEDLLQWTLDNLSVAGCSKYREPWHFLKAAGRMDHPLAKAVVEKQIPLVLRAQRKNGGWSGNEKSPALERSRYVLRALKTHGLLEALSAAPPLPPDWKVVKAIPAPVADSRGLLWDGEVFWTYVGESNEAVAFTRDDGKEVRRVKLPEGGFRGLGLWDGAFALTQGNPWKEDDPKRLVKVDKTNGEILETIMFDDPKLMPMGMMHMGGAFEVGERLWVVDSFFGQVQKIDPAAPDRRPSMSLSGPLAVWIAPQGNDAVWHWDLWAPYIMKNDLEGALLDFGEKPFDGRCDGLAWDGKRLWGLDARNGRVCAIEK